jgi:hypothetical protein
LDILNQKGSAMKFNRALFLLLGIVCIPIVLAGGPAAFGASGKFQPHVDYRVGGTPDGMVVGDFNGDGKMDIVTANNPGSSVSILLAKGNGKFYPFKDYTTGNGALAVTAGDLNGDGKLDLVSSNYADGTVSVLLGNGDGTFQPKQDYQVDLSPNYTVIGDYNQDGKPDLAAVNQGFWGSAPGHTVSVLLGNGDGTFQPKIDYDTCDWPGGLAAGDFNHDGILDLVSSCDHGPWLGVLIGNGDGTFQPFVEYASGGQASKVAVADFNNDGNLDLASVSYSTNTVGVLLGKGDGTFEPYVNYQTGASPYNLAVGDLNNDGNVDLVIANSALFGGTADSSVLMGKGDGTFLARVDYPTSSNPEAAGVGDFNGDGALDLAFSDYYGSSVSVLLNSGGTRLSLDSSANPAALGQPVVLTLTVTPTFSGVGAVSGIVAFKDGSIVLGTAPIASGQASFTTSSLAAGNHDISAVYSGDKNFNRRRSKTLVQVVNP